MSTLHRQSGAALLVSLIILLILSVIGISAVRGGLLQSLMSSNSQQTLMTFRGADSGAGAVKNQFNLEKINDTGIPVVVMNSGVAGIVRFIDQNGALSVASAYFDNAATNVQTTTLYLGDSPSWCAANGSSISDNKKLFGCNIFQVSAQSTLGNQNGTAVQWLTVLGADND